MTQNRRPSRFFLRPIPYTRVHFSAERFRNKFHSSRMNFDWTWSLHNDLQNKTGYTFITNSVMEIMRNKKRWIVSLGFTPQVAIFKILFVGFITLIMIFKRWQFPIMSVILLHIKRSKFHFRKLIRSPINWKIKTFFFFQLA